MKKVQLLHVLWVIPIVFVLSVIIGALGSTTMHYQCKYVKGVEVKVADHEKYTSAVYAVQYDDGTVGPDSVFYATGLDKGAVCKTVLKWGWPYQATNRNVTDQSQVKQ